MISIEHPVRIAEISAFGKHNPDKSVFQVPLGAARDYVVAPNAMMVGDRAGRLRRERVCKKIVEAAPAWSVPTKNYPSIFWQFDVVVRAQD